MDEEVLNLVNKQVQQAISDALNCLTQIGSSTAQNSPSNRFIKPNAPLRCRSTGDNRTVPFRSAISSGSLPATESELIYYQSSRQTTNNNGSNRAFDVQYSYSLNKPWITEINKRQNNLIGIQNFVNQFIEHSIQTALLQVCYFYLIAAIQSKRSSSIHTINYDPFVKHIFLLVRSAISCFTFESHRNCARHVTVPV
jgi:hypothetical protein